MSMQSLGNSAYSNYANSSASNKKEDMNPGNEGNTNNTNNTSVTNTNNSTTCSISTANATGNKPDYTKGVYCDVRDVNGGIHHAFIISGTLTFNPPNPPTSQPQSVPPANTTPWYTMPIDPHTGNQAGVPIYTQGANGWQAPVLCYYEVLDTPKTNTTDSQDGGIGSAFNAASGLTGLVGGTGSGSGIPILGD